MADTWREEEEIEVYLVDREYFPKKMRGDLLEVLLPMCVDDDAPEALPETQPTAPPAD